VRSAVAVATTAVVLVALTAALHAPVLADLSNLRILGAFHDGHVWAFDRIAHLITGEEPWSRTTAMAAFPGKLDIRYLAWVPALLALPFRPLLGPLGAYNAVVLLSPALAGLAAWGLFRKALDADAWTAGAGAVTYALCPFALGNLANGQTEKASHWLLPLFLWALTALLEGPGWILPSLGLVLATLAAAFTEPTLTLLVPLAAACQGVAALVGARGRRGPVLARLLVASALAAAALAPAWRYYTGPAVPDASTLNPGPEFSADVLPDPPPIAQPEDTFLGRGRRETNPELCNHVTYLGLPLLAAALVLSARRRRGWGLALAWAVTGTLVAFGPHLASGGQYVRWHGQTLRMPAWILESLHYPLRDAGMWYRVILLGSLGLSAALATGTTFQRRRWIGILLAWALALASVADGVHATWGLWPRPVARVPGRALLAQMASDPHPGGVIDLPMDTDTYGNGVHLVSAVFHGRPTTSLAAHTRVAEMPNLSKVWKDVEEATVTGQPDLTRAALCRRGYRYVVWRPNLRSFGRELSAWTAILGSPRTEDGTRIWILDDLEPAP